MCINGITSFPKLYIERFMDNLIPAGDLARPFSLSIFTLCFIQTPSLFLRLYNVGFLSVSFLIFPHIFFFSSSHHPPKNLQTACSLCKSLAFYSQFSSSALNETSRKRTRTLTRLPLVLTTLYCNGNGALHDILMHHVP